MFYLSLFPTHPKIPTEEEKFSQFFIVQPAFTIFTDCRGKTAFFEDLFFGCPSSLTLGVDIYIYIQYIYSYICRS